MKRVVFCEKCAYFGTSEDNTCYCPQCESKLIVIDDITESDWNSKNDEEKAAIKASWGFTESIIEKKKEILRLEKLLKYVSDVKRDSERVLVFAYGYAGFFLYNLIGILLLQIILEFLKYAFAYTG
ncbi:MAG: hypothetical protein K5662_05630 [Lachnospiraceae bacterium]|nr:hypothetical protein [Lachnospiraceae bacterium]